MSEFVPVSRERHAGRHWRRQATFAFAREMAVVPVVAAEIAQVTLAFPMTFLKENDIFVPVALLSLDGQRNLFVAPDGRWLGSYSPAMLRSHPFALLRDTQGNLVLCIDEATGLLPGNESGTPFFDEDGLIAAPTRSVLDFLTTLERSRMAARQVVATLDGLGLVVPWDITVTSATGSQKVAGPYRIDEAALNALPAADFAGLRTGGAVGLALCQILSTQHLETLNRLSVAQAAHHAADRTILQEALRDPNAVDAAIDWTMFAEPAFEGGDTVSTADARDTSAPPADQTKQS